MKHRVAAGSNRQPLSKLKGRVIAVLRVIAPKTGRLLSFLASKTVSGLRRRLSGTIDSVAASKAVDRLATRLREEASDAHDLAFVLVRTQEIYGPRGMALRANADHALSDVRLRSIAASEALARVAVRAASALPRNLLAARSRAAEFVSDERLVAVRSKVSGTLTRKALSEKGERLSALLNRQVLTPSDKKTIYQLKAKIIDDLPATAGRVLKTTVVAASRRAKRTFVNAKTVAAAHLVEARLARLLTVDTLRTSLDALARGLGHLVPARAQRVVMTEGNTRRFLSAKGKAQVWYSGFKLWLRKPVTVGMVIEVVVVWAFAITFRWLAFPWSEIGYTSGYGAIFMTAALAARLTVNSPRLWLERPASRQTKEVPKEASKEVNAWIIQTAIARRSLVVHEIEEFLQSNLDGRVKELNLKANAFLMRKKDWKSLQDALYDTFLRGAPPLLFELGHRLGSSVGRDLMRLEDRPGAILSQLEEVSRTLGWGMVSVQGDLARGSKLTFVVRESPFSVAESPLGKNTESCHMLVGMMTGIAEEIFGWPCSSVEQRCARDGGDACKIVVTPALVPTHKERWNLSVLFPVLHPWSR